MNVLFFVKESGETSIEGALPEDGYTYTLWTPSATRILPPGASAMPFAIWWSMHHLRVLGNRDYSLLLIFKGDTVVHRSCIFPPYFRFPFMDKNDLQIGDTWTAEEHRGKGLATFAITKIFELAGKPGRRFWYVVEGANMPSVRAVEKAGFAQIGKGRRIHRLGMRVIGSYLLET